MHPKANPILIAKLRRWSQWKRKKPFVVCPRCDSWFREDSGQSLHWHGLSIQAIRHCTPVEGRNFRIDCQALFGVAHAHEKAPRQTRRAEISRWYPKPMSRKSIKTPSRTARKAGIKTSSESKTISVTAPIRCLSNTLRRSRCRWRLCPLATAQAKIPPKNETHK